MFSVLEVQLQFIIMQNSAIDNLAEDIDICCSEFSCADALFEEKIKFGEWPALRLWDTEVGVDYAAKADAALKAVRTGDYTMDTCGDERTQKKPA